MLSVIEVSSKCDCKPGDFVCLKYLSIFTEIVEKFACGGRPSLFSAAIKGKLLT